MSHYSLSSSLKALDKVQYHPSYVYEGVRGGQHVIPATVWVDFGRNDLRLCLEIADADALMSALAVALVEHAVAQRDSGSGPKAVA